MKVLAVISTLAKDIERLNETVRSLRKYSSTNQFEVQRPILRTHQHQRALRGKDQG